MNKEPSINYVYIFTNKTISVFDIGVTTDLLAIIEANKNQNYGNENSFATKLKCFDLLYYELFEKYSEAKERRSFLQRLSQKKKESIITKLNPRFQSLNHKFEQQNLLQEA